MYPQVPPVANDYEGLLHTNWGRWAGLRVGRDRIKCSLELLPSMDRIYGDSEHPMTEIDLEAEQIYAKMITVAAHGRTASVQILET